MKLGKIFMITGFCILIYLACANFVPSVFQIQTQNFEKENYKKDITEFDYVRAEFERVIDGDTIIVIVDGEREPVRLIGIDTPESVKPNSPVECFGKEASDFLKKELQDQKYVYLEFDKNAGKRDRNGRLLAHIYTRNLENLNRKIVADGYGYEYTYQGQNYLHKAEYKQAQVNAKKQKKGLWSDVACSL